MSPASLVLILLAAIAPALAGQAATTASWTLASGEYTIYGHTDYVPTFRLVPRIVYDTARGLDSARVVDSVRATPAPGPDPGAGPGLAAGVSNWPTALYCEGPVSATVQPLEPRQVLGRIQLAARCGMRLVIVPPRRFLTTNGQTQGVFSTDSARRVTDRYAAVLPPDTLRKYRATILGFNLADDYRCEDCWGGREITQAQIAVWAAYARGKLPGVPLGVRVTPDWVAAYPTLAPLLDYAWAQYHTRRGEPQAYFDNAARIAGTLGLRMVMGVNVEDCYGVGTAPCPPGDLVRFGTLALEHPGTCAFLSWRYDEETWAREEIVEAWERLLAEARGRPARECRRGA